MKILRAKDYDDMSRKAANIIAAQITLNPQSVLGLATGSSPVGTYKNLVAMYEAGDLDFSEVSSYNLDEYRGISRVNDQSYYYFMNDNLFDHVNINKDNTHVPNGENPDADNECTTYDAAVRAIGGVDLQLLGLGRNGHIGFNEPGKAFIRETHVVDLAQSTIEANARFFQREEEVPRQAITMGVGAIMAARRVVVAVSGADKAEAVRAAFCGPITPEVPASILQLHRDVVLVGDAAALSGLREAGVLQ